MTQKEIIIDGVTYICTPKEEVKKVEHEFVDLGLPSGRLWATCNIGAEKPTDCGDYFAWGATEPYNLMDCDTDNYDNTEAAKLIEMDDAHDAAKVLWGKEWRMPNLTNFAELIDFCDYHVEEIDGILCAIYSSKVNDNKLILPSAGYVSGGSLYYRGSYGHYWSRSRYSSTNAWRLGFNSSGRNVNTSYRYIGVSVRPVRSIEQTI
jgi:uncharacterized protein (TIGR02145 family)